MPNSIAPTSFNNHSYNSQTRNQALPVQTTQQVIIFDAQVDDLSLLLAGLNSHIQSYVLSPERDGVEQITEILQQQPTETLTLVAHGFSGGLKLGDSSLELSNLQDYSHLLQEWFAVGNSPKLQLLACNVAVGDAGTEFIQKLQTLCNAKITASNRTIGNGHWPSIAESLFADRTLREYNFTLNWEVVGNAPQFSDGVIEMADLEVDGDIPYVVYKNRGDGQLTLSKFENGNWATVGTPGVAAGGFNFNADVELIGDTPYIVYLDANDGDKAKVIQFDGNSWLPVGGAVSEAGAAFIDLEVDNNGKLYVLYRDVNQGEKATLKRLDGNNWVTVGPAGFSEGPIVANDGTTGLDLEISADGTPYVIYNYTGPEGDKASVQAFINGNWTTIGNDDFADNRVSFPNLEILDGTPYIAYSDPNDGDKAVVQTLNDNNEWVVVGNGAASTTSAFSPDLEFDRAGTPYVVYADNTGRATVRKLQDGTWTDVGNTSFSGAAAPYTDLAINNSGIPYVVYRDESEGDGRSKPTVQRLPNNVVLDNIDPDLISITRQTPNTETTDADTLVFQVAFSEDVQGVDATDFAITNASINADIEVTEVAGDLYNVTISGKELEDFNGVIGLELVDSPDITDLATTPNNLSAIDPITVETYTLDNSEDGGSGDGGDGGDGGSGGGGDGGAGATGNILTVFSEINVLAVTQLESNNTIQWQLNQGDINNVSEIIVFETDASGNNDVEITRFSLLQTGDLPAAYNPVFTIDSSFVSKGDFFQFAIVENNVTLFSEITAITDSEVSLDFGNGIQGTTYITEEVLTTNLLVNDAQAIDLTGQTGTVDVSFNVFREAAFNNTVGFYTLATDDGGVVDPLTGNTIRPGETGYKEAAIANSLDIELTGQNGQASTFEASILAGQQLGIFVIIDGIDPIVDDVVFSYGSANTGNADHIRKVGDNTFGIEDLPELGDMDFDDVVIEFAVI
ncbi:DUF4347 domain-containing protein [Leptolyngbya sp. Heron Island J]|uniref:DUF4347 domain-containing protein n=1 Tax=Leptolyngbya sp. Heron Island J TaxID=1385935 RepID=UPI0003F73A34|nr:DUF4347 domain-containing protein [Leptolyngbya sp. Heron Island J]